MGDLLSHHTPRDDLHWVICLIRRGVLLFQSVKQDGWLREDVFECFKSDSIWSGEVSQPPFKVEITPQTVSTWIARKMVYALLLGPKNPSHKLLLGEGKWAKLGQT